MADSSTTIDLILVLAPGGYWARRQLHAGIRYISVASILMKSLSTVGWGPGKAERGCAGDPRARCQIPPQPLGQFQI